MIRFSFLKSIKGVQNRDDAIVTNLYSEESEIGLSCFYDIMNALKHAKGNVLCFFEVATQNSEQYDSLNYYNDWKLLYHYDTSEVLKICRETIEDDHRELAIPVFPETVEKDAIKPSYCEPQMLHTIIYLSKRHVKGSEALFARHKKRVFEMINNIVLDLDLNDL